MLSPEEGKAFFTQLLHGLLGNVQPMQQSNQHQEQQLQDSALREPSKDMLAAICQLLGPEVYLLHVLQSVNGLSNQAAPVDPNKLEVMSLQACSWPTFYYVAWMVPHGCVVFETAWHAMYDFLQLSSQLVSRHAGDRGLVVHPSLLLLHRYHRHTGGGAVLW